MVAGKQAHPEQKKKTLRGWVRRGENETTMKKKYHTLITDEGKIRPLFKHALRQQEAKQRRSMA